MKKLIVANWKMNPNSVAEAKMLFNGTLKASRKIKNVEVVVCPPSVWLGVLSNLKKGKISLGSQDVFWENPPSGGGSYTGEISAKMLKNLGARYVIIGHSEKRKNGETNEIINKKIRQALNSGLKVIFCVGEMERDESGNYLQFIKEELMSGLNKIPVKILKNLIIAYEPIWAISSNRKSKACYNPDTPEETFQMVTYIKRIMVSVFGKSAGCLPILYGGSADPENALEFLNKGNVDGLLVGRTSWSVKSFGELLKNISAR